MGDLEGGAYFCIKKAVCEIGSKNQLFFMLLIQLRVRDSTNLVTWLFLMDCTTRLSESFVGGMTRGQLLSLFIYYFFLSFSNLIRLKCASKSA